MCNVLLKDETGQVWQTGISDAGELTADTVSAPIAFLPGPLLQSNGFVWRLGIDAAGEFILDTTTPPTIQLPLQYIPMTSPSGAAFTVTVNDQGELIADSTSAALPDFIPTIPDVSMSRWPDKIGVICAKCNNATVTVSGDLSCWCCACNQFIWDEDTTLIVVLDE